MRRFIRVVGCQGNIRILIVFPYSNNSQLEDAMKGKIYLQQKQTNKLNEPGFVAHSCNSTMRRKLEVRKFQASLGCMAKACLIFFSLKTVFKGAGR